MVVLSITTNIKRNLFSSKHWGWPLSKTTIDWKGHDVALFEHGDLINGFKIEKLTDKELWIHNTSHTPEIIRVLCDGGRSPGGLSKNKVKNKGGRQLMQRSPGGNMIPARDFFNVRQPATLSAKVVEGEVILQQAGMSITDAVVNIFTTGIVAAVNKQVNKECRRV